MAKRILAIYPHPDDETFGKAGTFIKHTAAGDEVTLICATMGQMGRRMGRPFFANRETLTEIREQELADACEELGVKDIRLWHMQDKTLQFRAPSVLADKILKVIEEIKPEIIYTYYPAYGVHPDHDALSAATVLAVSRMPKENHPIIYGSVVTKNPIEKLGAPDVVKDVSDVLDQKMRAMDAHRSQSELVTHPLKEKIKKDPDHKDFYMKPYTKEKYWIYPTE